MLLFLKKKMLTNGYDTKKYITATRKDLSKITMNKNFIACNANGFVYIASLN